MNVLAESPNLENINKFNKPTDTNNAVFQILKKSKFDNITDYLSSLNEGITYNFKTIETFFQKYPSISEEIFKKLFFIGNYNRNILMQNPETLKLFDFNNIIPGSDLIEIFIKKISLNEMEFNSKIEEMNLDIITFPGLSISDIAQQKFHSKLSNILKNIKIIFGDEEGIREYYQKNEINIDSVGYWGYLDKIPNMCAFKLLKSELESDKLLEVNKIFNSFEENIFIGGSTDGIPFSTKNVGAKNITLSRYSEKNGEIKLNKNSLDNSLGYLNSTYYADKVIGAFVSKDHNIMEPLHAGKPTISNLTENRYNHNWLSSYIGEKVGLLHFVDSSKSFVENQKNIDNFLSTPKEEISKRKEKLDSLLDNELKEFVYGYLYSILKNNLKMQA